MSKIQYGRIKCSRSPLCSLLRSGHCCHGNGAGRGLEWVRGRWRWKAEGDGLSMLINSFACCCRASFFIISFRFGFVISSVAVAPCHTPSSSQLAGPVSLRYFVCSTLSARRQLRLATGNLKIQYVAENQRTKGDDPKNKFKKCNSVF